MVVKKKKVSLHPNYRHHRPSPDRPPVHPQLWPRPRRPDGGEDPDQEPVVPGAGQQGEVPHGAQLVDLVQECAGVVGSLCALSCNHLDRCTSY